MTPQEAIKILKEVREEAIAKETELSRQVFENIGIKAIDLAIKALEQQPKTETHGSTYGGVSWGGTYKSQQPCEDCISRTELLSRIDEERKHLLDIKMDGAEHVIVHHARRIIEDMPSVTPMENDKLKYLKGRPCEVCEFHSDNGCSRWKCVFEEVLNDTGRTNA